MGRRIDNALGPNVKKPRNGMRMRFFDDGAGLFDGQGTE